MTTDFPVNLYAKLNYSHELHGNNIYDSQGNLIRNVGGDVFQNLTVYDPVFANLLDGERERTDIISLSVDYEFLYGFYGGFAYQYINKFSNIIKTKNHIISGSVRISFE